MKRSVFMMFFVAVLFAFVSCSSSSGDSDSSSNPESGLELASNSAKATPQIPSGTLLLSVSKNLSPVKDATSESLNMIESFFKLECHTDNNSLNFCPAGVDSTSLDTKFSTTTLIGFIQHADMYLNNIYQYDMVPNPETGISVLTPTYKACGKGTNPAELVNHTPIYSPTNSNTFMVDFGSMLDCVSQFVFVNKTDYGVYAKADDNLHFAAAITRKQESGSVGSVSYTPSDIFQSYVRRSSTGAPVILGFNLAAFSYYSEGASNNTGQRALLITNISSGKFVVKYDMRAEFLDYTDKNTSLVAIGIAGYDPTSGSWQTGNYLVKVKFHDEDATMTCVKNAATPELLDNTPVSAETWTDSDTPSCTDVNGFFAETGWTWTELLTWLGATEDATQLAGFEDFFSTPDFLSTESTVVPYDGTTYFPDSISAM